MTNNGFLITATNTQTQREACACAYSIKSMMPNASVSLVVPRLSAMSKEFEKPFDNIIEMKFGELGITRQNEWQLWWLTPYENTIVLSSKTLVKTDLTNTFAYLEDNHDVCFPNQILNFKNEKLPIEDPRYAHYSRYEITPLYSDMWFFKKSDAALEYFKLLDPYMQNYKDLSSKIVSKEHLTGYFDNNFIHSVIVKHLDILEDVKPLIDNIFTYVDMGIAEYYFTKKYDNWMEYLNIWPSAGGKVKIQNFAMTEVFAYQESEFLDEEMFNGQQTYYTVVTRGR